VTERLPKVSTIAAPLDDFSIARPNKRKERKTVAVARSSVRGEEEEAEQRGEFTMENAP